MLSPNLSVADLLTCYSLATPLFIELHIDCIGCYLNKFCTLDDLCKYYDLDMKKLSDRIQGQGE